MEPWTLILPQEACGPCGLCSGYDGCFPLSLHLGAMLGMVAGGPGNVRYLTTDSSTDWATGLVLKSSAFLIHISTLLAD